VKALKDLKARWTVLAVRIDALSQRERILAFLAAAAVLVFAVQAVLLGPQLRKQATLQTQIAQQRKTLAGIDQAIADLATAFAIDPDRPLHERLQGVEHESERLAEQLRTMERGVVPPERVAPLLETILRANPRLKLVSMKTLPVTPLRDPTATMPAATAAAAAAAAPLPPTDPAALAQTVVANAAKATAAPAQPSAAGAAAAPAQEPDLLFRHGVELTVRGGYLDLVDYMNTLESMPTQLFWGKAQLEVEDYPTVRLTLTLYTLSLDTKWMKL